MSICSFDIVVQIVKFCDVTTCNVMACVNSSFRANICSIMSSNVLISISHLKRPILTIFKNSGNMTKAHIDFYTDFTVPYLKKTLFANPRIDNVNIDCLERQDFKVSYIGSHRIEIMYNGKLCVLKLCSNGVVASIHHMRKQSKSCALITI